MGKTRILLLFFAVLFALPVCSAPARADDAELLKQLPGTWTLSAAPDEPAESEGQEAVLALLTLAQDGALSLRCSGSGTDQPCTYEGTWSFELVPEDMDRLTLVFTSTDHPAHADSPYRVECVYAVYTESWEENDTRHTYLLLEDPVSSGLSPFEEALGDDGAWPLGLYREQGPNARIVNCKEYVSLREKRAKSAARLAKVPLGALVLAFPETEENGFILCSYHDEYGYILSEYLQFVK